VRPVSIALVHYPVLDGEGQVVTTAVTNLDVHDLARSARTYGCAHYFIVHPIHAQRELVERIRSHWVDGPGGKRIPDRKAALDLVRIVPSLDDALVTLGGRDHVDVWVTTARDVRSAMPLSSARQRIVQEADGGGGRPVLIVFGTGWGLAREVIDAADAVLPPLRAAASTGYNHLSVRSACAIVLDRLLGAQ